MSEPDFSGVHPLRLQQMRDRVAAISSYLELDQPTADDRTRYAGRLGLGVSQFLTLVRTWNLYRDVSRLHGAGAARGRTRPTGPRNLPARAKAEARRILADTPADATLEEAHALVEAGLSRAGLPVPSRSTTWRLLREAPRGPAPGEGFDDVVVARVRLRLPMRASGGLARPEVVIAARVGDGRVAAAAVSGPATDRAAIEAACRTAERTGARVSADERLAWASAPPLVRIEPGKAKHLLARVLGKTVAGVEIVYNADTRTRPAALLTTEADRALTPAEVASLLDGAVVPEDAVPERAAPRDRN